jgi:hypothetical protein
MGERDGTLRMTSSGRWAVCRPWREPVEIKSSELFRVEVRWRQRSAIDSNGIIHRANPPGILASRLLLR